MMLRKAALILSLSNALLFATLVSAQQQQDVTSEQYYSENSIADDANDDESYDIDDDSYDVDQAEYDESEEVDDYEYQDSYYDEDDYSVYDYQGDPNLILESGESLPRSERSKRYYAEIEKILAGAEFAQQEKVTRRRLKDVTDKETREEKFPQWIIDFVKAFEGAGDGLAMFATFLEILVWSLVIGAIVFVVAKYRSQLQTWVSTIGAGEIETELPISLFGLDIQKDSVPDDVVETAQGYWLNDEKRQAVAVLLRSSLIKLLHEHSCRFFSSDTEAECCDRINQQVTEPISVYMRKLVVVWQRTAYAHIDPSEGEFKQLCLQWSDVFK